jgi:endogenous inhibitor of DNA gyrase (YacG/DUF329 family)
MHTLGLKLTNRHNQIKLRKNRISLTTANVFAYFNPKILSESIMPHTFPCPRCGEMSQWEDNAFRPFCSERCKLIDLGAPMMNIASQRKMQGKNSEE